MKDLIESSPLVLGVINFIVLMILYCLGIFIPGEPVFIGILLSGVLAVLGFIAEFIIFLALVVIIIGLTNVYAVFHNPICDMLHLSEYKINL